MAGSGSALALAARLRSLDDDVLTRLVTQRQVRAAGIHDFFDLAEALLDRGSVQAARASEACTSQASTSAKPRPARQAMPTVRF